MRLPYGVKDHAQAYCKQVLQVSERCCDTGRNHALRLTATAIAGWMPPALQCLLLSCTARYQRTTQLSMVSQSSSTRTTVLLQDVPARSSIRWSERADAAECCSGRNQTHPRRHLPPASRSQAGSRRQIRSISCPRSATAKADLNTDQANLERKLSAVCQALQVSAGQLRVFRLYSIANHSPLSSNGIR